MGVNLVVIAFASGEQRQWEGGPHVEVNFFLEKECGVQWVSTTFNFQSFQLTPVIIILTFSSFTNLFNDKSGIYATLYYYTNK